MPSELHKEINAQRSHAENAFSIELETIKLEDKRPKPNTWNLSPWGVLLYIAGGKTASGFQVTPKYIGDHKLIEMAIATILSDRALLLMGVPGTAKSWLSEHLSAAISGQSNLLIQGTSGTSEDNLRYGWNYADLISKGHSLEALVKSPVLRAMETGKIVRIEELTRIPTEVQDALISILSEKTIPIPELNHEYQAINGFNLIATANDQDKGIYPISAALQRRFNTLYMPLPHRLEDEIRIVKQRVDQLGQSLSLPLDQLQDNHLHHLLTIFRELRNGITSDGKQKLKSTKSSWSPAETISMVHHARIQHHFFSQQAFGPGDLVNAMFNNFIKVDEDERNCIQEYNESVLKKRQDFKEWYESIKKISK